MMVVVVDLVGVVALDVVLVDVAGCLVVCLFVCLFVWLRWSLLLSSSSLLLLLLLWFLFLSSSPRSV